MSTLVFCVAVLAAFLIVKVATDTPFWAIFVSAVLLGAWVAMRQEELEP